MGFRGLFEGWHIVLLILVVVVVFGRKRLPDASRSLGRSLRIFKSEMGEMKHDGKPSPSAASRDTVHGDVIHEPAPPATGQAPRPTADPEAGPEQPVTPPSPEHHPRAGA